MFESGKSVVNPPSALPTADGTISGGWWHQDGNSDRLICDLCPRECNMKPGDRGFCFVRQNIDGEMKLTTYGRSTGFCIDAIEKKPLNHFYPGTSVLSFGTAGCNLGCKFCQNWDISKSREVAGLSELATPETIASAAIKNSCRSVAFTYNDPIIWAEYAIDTAKACRDVGVKSVAVTAGYISSAARPAFFHAMDAANVDLKAFTEDFYRDVTYSHLQPVLDTLHWLKHESDVWFEITNLLIPDANDSPDELRTMCDWILESVGSEVPVHFTAFHPDFRMTDRTRTPHETLLQAKQIAEDQGIKFVYIGNVHDVKNQSTWCPNCRELLIERDWHQLGQYAMRDNRCGKCNHRIAGHFDDLPGTWGRRRQPIRIHEFASTGPPPGGIDTAEKVVPLRTPPPLCKPPPLTPLPTPSVSVRNTETGNMSQVLQDSSLLTDDQESAIHKAACEIVEAAVNHRLLKLTEPELLNAADMTVMGVFVTLKRKGQLRGCCGSVGQPMNLLSALKHSGARTATDDHRFPSVSSSELPFLTLDVTLLFNFEPVNETGTDRIAAVEVGRHGLRIARGENAGLLLPIVAIERDWDSETFLNQVCLKASLPVTAWKQDDTQLVRFEGRMIEREFDRGTLARNSAASKAPYTADDAKSLSAFAASNIAAQVQGAVPSCFPINISDGMVDGIAIRVSFAGSDTQRTFSRIQFREGLALQTTLLNMTASAAAWLQSINASPQAISSMTVDAVLFYDIALHGPCETADIEGIDTSARAILVMEGQKNAWCYSLGLSAADLLKQTAEAASVTMPESARVFSLGASCSTNDFSFASVPAASAGANIRPAAVAGRFYPSAPGALAAVTKRCLGDVPGTKTKCPAIMVPHAGLQYSGRIAADVLKAVEIPEHVIVIGPKHTAHGVDWAVAPHATWQLPDGVVDSDPEFAKHLTDSIDGLLLDSAAHAQEHCIEVELPFLKRLAPNSRVIGITIGSGNWERCQKFARQLAKVISEMETAPLLVISSDMNHFATDEENRKLDELALQAMESLNPEQLFETVMSNSISMCGVLPAVIVMETLKQLKQLNNIERISYATSANVSDDYGRVVGYAGLLLKS